MLLRFWFAGFWLSFCAHGHHCCTGAGPRSLWFVPIQKFSLPFGSYRLDSIPCGSSVQSPVWSGSTFLLAHWAGPVAPAGTRFSSCLPFICGSLAFLLYLHSTSLDTFFFLSSPGSVPFNQFNHFQPFRPYPASGLWSVLVGCLYTQPVFICCVTTRPFSWPSPSFQQFWVIVVLGFVSLCIILSDIRLIQTHLILPKPCLLLLSQALVQFVCLMCGPDEQH